MLGASSDFGIRLQNPETNGCGHLPEVSHVCSNCTNDSKMNGQCLASSLSSWKVQLSKPGLDSGVSRMAAQKLSHVKFCA